MLNYIQGIHEHENELCPACPHGDIQREWMNPGKNRSLLCLWQVELPQTDLISWTKSGYHDTKIPCLISNLYGWMSIGKSIESKCEEV